MSTASNFGNLPDVLIFAALMYTLSSKSIHKRKLFKKETQIDAFLFVGFIIELFLVHFLENTHILKKHCVRAMCDEVPLLLPPTIIRHCIRTPPIDQRPELGPCARRHTGLWLCGASNYAQQGLLQWGS